MRKIQGIAGVIGLILISAASGMEGNLQDSVTVDLLGKSEADFLTGLQNLGFYETAEFYCKRKIRQPTAPQQKAGYARELLRILTSQLLTVPPQSRTAVHAKIQEVSRPWETAEITNPYQPLLTLQRLLSELQYAEILRLESEFTAASTDTAKEILRHAEETAERNIRSLQEKVRTADAQTVQQYLSLSRHFQLRQGTILMNLALCHPEMSAERVDLLQQAAGVLDKLIGISTEDPAFWSAWLDGIQANRFLGDTKKSAAILQKLLEKNPPQEILLRAKAESVLLALADGDAKEALTRIENAGVSPNVSPHFELARLQTYLELWKEKSQPELRQNQILEQTQSLENVFGPYWGHRSQLLLSHFDDFLSGDSRLAEQRGDAAFRAGQTAEAIRLYDQAAESAKKENPAEAFRLGKKSGLLVHKLCLQAQESQAENLISLEQETLRRFQELAARFSDNPEAETVDLWSIFHAGKLVEHKTLDISEYVKLLERHFLTWPQSPHAEKLRLDTALLLENRKEYQEAIRFLAPIPNRSPLAKTALETAKRCFSGKNSENSEDVQTNREAAMWFFGRIADSQGNLTAVWNDADAECLLEAVQFQFRAKDYSGAEKLLKTAIQNHTVAADTWKAAAESLLACSLAGQGRLEEAVRNLTKIQQIEPGIVLAAIDNLEKMTPLESQKTQKTLTMMQIQLIDTLDSQKANLSSEQIQELERLRAVGLAKIGQIRESVHLFQALLKKYPDNMKIFVSLGQVLLEQPEEETALNNATRIWQTIESRTAPQSELWWDSKEAMLRILLKRGKRQEAAKALELLEILYPDMGGMQRKAKLREIMKKG
ncbi:MAG: tetratricopeptide repeat protein [Planctomycetaceae bacterium]|nr:tetratricopeptide repeat protein [Planctomycetaceae bacterium]